MMGYETKLIIGRSGFDSEEVARGEKVLDGDEFYAPFLKDENGDYVYTGRTQIYFSVYAVIDLCKCGYDSNISGLDRKNTDDSKVWYYYEGDQEVKEDCYGDKLKPVPIKDVINALSNDVKEDDYCRFRWALALLNEMAGEKECIECLLYGH